MIIQRLAQAIRRQDWFQVVIEVLIVIVGIFLGMQVTDWNELRKDNDRSEIIVDRLLEDIEMDKRYLQSRLDHYVLVRNFARQAENWLAKGELVDGSYWNEEHQRGTADYLHARIQATKGHGWMATTH